MLFQQELQIIIFLALTTRQIGSKQCLCQVKTFLVAWNGFRDYSLQSTYAVYMGAHIRSFDEFQRV